MIYQYVTKVYRQHSTMITSVPKAVREELGITDQDNLLWEVDPVSGFVQMCKVVRRGEINAKDSRNSGRKDRGGGA